MSLDDLLLLKETLKESAGRVGWMYAPERYYGNVNKCINLVNKEIRELKKNAEKIKS